MPELPEVETICRFVRSTILGEKFQQIEVNCFALRFPITFNSLQSLIGSTVTDVNRFAKYLIISTNSQHLLVNFGMSGKFLYNNLLPKHNHVIFTFSNSKQFTFNDPRKFGSIRLINNLESFFNNHGIEPFDSNFTGSYLHNLLRTKKSPIKAILLNQSIVVGIGNIYAAESLYFAKISPHRIASTLSLLECEQLVVAIKLTLRNSIEAKGCSIKDYQLPNGVIGNFQNKLSVYNKESKPCQNCTAPIKRTIQNGRSSFYCINCQV